MCSDKEKDVLFSIKYLKKGTIVCVFYNISVYLSPKKDGYCRFKQKTMTRKQTGKIVLTLLLASSAFGRVQAQMVVRAAR